MADENVVILEEADENKRSDAQEEALVSLESLQQEQPKADQSEQIIVKKSNKKIFIAVGIGAFLLAIIVAIILFFVFKEDKKPNIDPAKLAKEIEERFEAQKFGASKIDDMIQKANLLYEKGNRLEALKIYENIATFNESLSNYNLGVSQMRRN